MNVKIDITHLGSNEEDVLATFVEELSLNKFHEEYLEDGFDGDDVLFTATIDDRVVCEAGINDEVETYFIWHTTGFIYKADDTDINILEQFEAVCEDFKNG